VLSEIERKEIDENMACSRNRSACVIEALKTIQKHRGWVSDEALREVSAYMGVTADELDSAATFYNLILRRPAGRHVIRICDSVTCWVTGEEGLVKRLREKLGITPGETTRDGRFTLVPIACLGICDRAPALMIDDDTHTGVTPEKLNAILDRYE
jgi:NADH-quinone oxidoreductase subunit E